MSVLLAENNYGKSRVRLVQVTRHPDRHDVKDLTVAIQFQGDFQLAHTAGDNRQVLPTDTMKNTVYALAKQHPVAQIEQFALQLIAWFLPNNPAVSRVRVEICERLWVPAVVSGKVHPFCFTSSGEERRIAVVSGTREAVSVQSGIEGLVALKTAQSGFEDFLKDRYTTLKGTGDRLLGTAIRATWLYTRPEVAFGSQWHGVRKVLLETFAQHESRSLQHTLYAMGEAVLTSYPEIGEIHLSLPNKHCLPVDLSPFGLENNNEIFLPVEEPHGLIEATLVQR